ncbi:MAG: nucleotidyltransferase [Lentisphaerae bacterium RIFOXYA12_FULL_48_11]|nr:MAG: nucleotidyltransferase [Lentisphaerae bacterium RIFOXYA12_FULL_48_11]
MNLTLAVMAAGIGSRYGGLKQMDPVGPAGEFIIDYSIHDAILAGFNKVVFIIRRDIESDFKSTIGKRVEKRIKVEYVFQELDMLPAGHAVPPERKKPWGTGHAVLACDGVIKEPFGVINADDFYGRQSYEVLARFLRDTSSEDNCYGMVGFILRNTLSEHGSVARGICHGDSNGNLKSVVECTKIEKTGNVIISNMPGFVLSGDEPVSMNMWGFKPGIFGFLIKEFGKFLGISAGNVKAEFFIPDVVNRLMNQDKVTVKLLQTTSSWFGITYPQDKQLVIEKIRGQIKAGIYPPDLLSLR